ncbi:hypothetical protein ACFOLG_08000 [Vogesella facilis]|uniref:NAD-dependent epimerase/dehydratase domain-containing protein n=1 Tax=Vogesella facilis TaxID=1655232 RepID=A0ABV7RGU0_9NEIS
MSILVTGGAGWIGAAQVAKLATPLQHNDYGCYLLALLQHRVF